MKTNTEDATPLVVKRLRWMLGEMGRIHGVFIVHGGSLNDWALLGWLTTQEVQEWEVPRLVEALPVHLCRAYAPNLKPLEERVVNRARHDCAIRQRVRARLDFLEKFGLVQVIRCANRQGVRRGECGGFLNRVRVLPKAFAFMGVPMPAGMVEEEGREAA